MKKARLLISMTVIVFICTAAWGAEKNAAEKVRSVLNEAMRIQTRPDLEGDAHRKQRAGLIRRLIADSFSEQEMSREVLLDQWERLSANQKSEFSSLFSTLFQDSYTRMVLDFLKEETVEYRGESQRPKGTLVRTVIMRANEHIPVDYVVINTGGKQLNENSNQSIC